MKRDMDLIRQILLYIDGEENCNGTNSVRLTDSPIDGRDWNEVSYHFILLHEAGLIRGQNRDNRVIDISGLSWEGHEFLDAIRDENVWEKTKSTATQIGSFSFETVKDVVKAALKKKIENLSDMTFEE